MLSRADKRSKGIALVLLERTTINASQSPTLSANTPFCHSEAKLVKKVSKTKGHWAVALVRRRAMEEKHSSSTQSAKITSRGRNHKDLVQAPLPSVAKNLFCSEAASWREIDGVRAVAVDAASLTCDTNDLPEKR